MTKFPVANSAAGATSSGPGPGPDLCEHPQHESDSSMQKGNDDDAVANSAAAGGGDGDGDGSDSYAFHQTGLTTKGTAKNKTDGTDTARSDDDHPSRFSTMQPTRNDVLFGRGRPLQRHTGNIRFHQILNKYRRQYQQSHDRHDRSDIVVKILLDVATPQRVVVVVPDEQNHNTGRGNDKGGGTGSEVTVVIPGGKFLKRRLRSPSANCSINTHNDDMGGQHLLPAFASADAAAGNEMKTSSNTAREVGGQKDMPLSHSSSDRDDNSDSNVDDDDDEDDDEEESRITGSGNATGVIPSSSAEAISALTAMMTTHPPTAATNVTNNVQQPATILRGEQNAAAPAAPAEKSGGDLDYDRVSVPTAKSIQQIIDKDDERVTGPITSGDASVGNVFTGTTNDHAEANAEAIRAKYILCHSMFSGVDWEEVPVNEAMEKIRHALRGGDEPIKPTLVSNINLPRTGADPLAASPASDSEQLPRGKRTQTMMDAGSNDNGLGGIMNNFGPASSKRPFYGSPGSNLLDVSTHAQLLSLLSFATPNNLSTGGAIPSSAPGRDRVGTSNQSSLLHELSSQSSMQQVPMQVPSLSTNVIPSQQQRRQHPHSLQHDLLRTLLTGQTLPMLNQASPSTTATDKDQMILQALQRQQLDVSTGTYRAKDVQCPPSTIDFGRSQQQSQYWQIHGSQVGAAPTAAMTNSSTADTGLDSVSAAAYDRTGILRFVQSLMSRGDRDGRGTRQPSVNHSAASTHDDDVRSILKKIQDLEQLRVLVDAQLEQARSEAFAVIQRALGGNTSACVPSSSSSTATAQTATRSASATTMLSSSVPMLSLTNNNNNNNNNNMGSSLLPSTSETLAAEVAAHLLNIIRQQQQK